MKGFTVELHSYKFSLNRGREKVELGSVSVDRCWRQGSLGTEKHRAMHGSLQWRENTTR